MFLFGKTKTKFCCAIDFMLLIIKGLAYAAKLGHRSVVEFFAVNGANIESRCHQDGLTPLMLATLCSLQKEVAHNLCPSHLKHQQDEKDSHADVVRALLAHGAVTDAVDAKLGRSALHFAALNGNEEILEQLLLAGGNGDAKDFDGWTPLMYAVQRGDKETALLLTRVGADVNRADNFGLTALAHAAHSGSSSLVRTLIDLGADCTIQDQSQRTPLYYAQASGHTEAAKIIENALRSTPKTEL